MLYATDELFAYRYAVLVVEIVEYGTEREGLGLFEEGKSLEELSLGLILAKLRKRLQKSAEDSFLSRTSADDIGSDTVD